MAGEFPAHWEVKRVKRLGGIRYGLGEPPEYVDDGLPFIRATDIKLGKIDLDTVKEGATGRCSLESRTHHLAYTKFWSFAAGLTRVILRSSLRTP